MTALRILGARLASLFGTRASDARIDEEIAAHIALATEDNIARGMAPDQARLAALRSFGGVMRTTEAWREARGFAGLDNLRQDVRYALRSYGKTPAFTFVALTTLTLAIGANTAIVSLLNALVLRDLPVRDPGSLVQVTTSTRTSPDSLLSYPMLQRLARDQQVFSSLMAWWGFAGLNVDTGRELTTGLVSAATGNLFDELGVRPAAGRLLEPGDMTLDPPAAQRVVVVGHTFWQQHFHGDPGAVGRTIRIETVPFTIVGVAPPGFTAFGLTAEPDFTVPLPARPLLNGRPVASLTSSATLSYLAVGRLKPAISLDQARAQLMTIWPAVRESALPPDYTGARRDDLLATRLAVASAATGNETSLRHRFTRPLVVVLGISTLVLVIACVNLASLMLSRAAARSHEMGVRLALGAGRWRLARQMLTEGVLLAIAGGAAGILAASWTCRALTSFIFEESRATIAFDARPDGRVMAATIATATLVGIVFSVVPAVRATRRSPAEALQQSARTGTATGRTGRLLVATQIALSLVLLAMAGVLVRSLGTVRAIQSGIERTDDVFIAYPWGRAGGFDGVDNDAYYPDLLRRVAALPGVRRVSASLLNPGTGGAYSELVAPGGESAMLERGVLSQRTPVSPGFFDAVGIQLVQGRDFAWSDRSRSARVAILSESLAKRLFADRAAIGQRVRIGLQPDVPALEVVGVAADARLYNVKNANVLAIYTAAVQDPQANYKCLVIRGTAVSLGDVKRAVESLGRENMDHMVTLRYISERALLQDRLTAMFSTFFGALALLLAAIGVYGLMSYTVEQRRREIGVRVALGADARRVMTEVVRDGVSVTFAGAAAGFAAALAAVQLVKSLLFGVAPHDPVTLAVAPLSLLLIALIACAIPARRAARVDPMIALRAE
jgi:putative ABC transport system permease protein